MVKPLDSTSTGYTSSGREIDASLGRRALANLTGGLAGIAAIVPAVPATMLWLAGQNVPNPVELVTKTARTAKNDVLKGGSGPS